MSHGLPNNLRLRILIIYKMLEKIKFGWSHVSLYSRNKTLAIEVQKETEAIVKYQSDLPLSILA